MVMTTKNESAYGPKPAWPPGDAHAQTADAGPVELTRDMGPGIQALAGTAGCGLLLLVVLLAAARRRLHGRPSPLALAACSMRGKTVVVTGANCGLGRATTLALARLGARVILAVRDSARGEEAAVELRRELGSEEAELVVRELDLASLASVRRFCARLEREEERLDVLVNNAGVFRCPYALTEDGFETQFGVNHLGHFLLTALLLPLLGRSAPSRVVVVSSALYKQGRINFDDLASERSYDPAAAYGRSKLANVMFARELARRLRGQGVTANALHPGVVRTNLGRHVSMPALARPLFNLLAWAAFRTPEQGARTAVFLAASPDVADVSGAYFGDCRQEELLPVATDDAVAAKLWEVSERLVGLRSGGPDGIPLAPSVPDSEPEERPHRGDPQRGDAKTAP
uniref:Retinol dehydrogenase 14-like n=2 Tax=Petromyzon marinus TaxID=7757 RepID=A0AAJ7TQ21_PETMA|nr:retinol dehydrogenase 14-like [Petromyzon marinus]